jgi:predicted nucleotidyltransferase
MDKNEIITKLQLLKPQIQKDYAVKNIALFGSFADGTSTDNSDIDIIIELEHPIGWKFFTLESLLQKTLNRKIDLVTKNAIKKQLKPFILKQIQYI